MTNVHAHFYKHKYIHCNTIKPHVKNKMYHNNTDYDNDNGAKNESNSTEIETYRVCPRCVKKKVIIIKCKTNTNANEHLCTFSNGIKNYHECLKCSITFCGQCKSISFHFGHPQCQQYADYQQALKPQFGVVATAGHGNNIEEKHSHTNNENSIHLLSVDSIMNKCFLISNIQLMNKFNCMILLLMCSKIIKLVRQH